MDEIDQDMLDEAKTLLGPLCSLIDDHNLMGKELGHEALSVAATPQQDPAHHLALLMPYFTTLSEDVMNSHLADPARPHIEKVLALQRRYYRIAFRGTKK